ncbi:hypothetical protein VX037_08870 [Gordonia sp. Z-3]|uniref:hypothetical protein n=1 Tax=Gordonia sp. Z-3 TaxID=3115408 RepID=UPI002E28B480|nr:hypothetical protein [Gordonia sp. Z-3]MED5801132.1 hypothetical protein [Gordonia sp. Z-3]
MSATWAAVDVASWLQADSEFEEPLGGKEKFWFTGPDGHRYLFKYARCDDEGSNVRGEDWAEWVVAELAALIGVPTATTRPGQYHGRRGILSKSVVSGSERLVHGNELLAGAISGYEADTERHNPGYTVEAIQKALADVGAPKDCGPSVESAFDAIAGYMMLDAWVAGRDRHHENWAVITDDGPPRLAPSYDHGNALGFQVPEEKLTVLAVDDTRLSVWSQRGRSHHFAGKPTLVDVAVEALSRTTPRARKYWLNRLSNVQVVDLHAILDGVPSSLMSDLGRKFRVRLLVHNRERIIDECSQLADFG